MNIIVLQHIKIEDPGYIKDLMIADGVNITTIELDEGQKIPNDLNKFDGMFCMGGPMDTWMEKRYPWLVNEKKKIRDILIINAYDALTITTKIKILCPLFFEFGWQKISLLSFCGAHDIMDPF